MSRGSTLHSNNSRVFPWFSINNNDLSLLEFVLTSHLRITVKTSFYGYLSLIEFFTVCTMLAEMAILYSKDFNNSKKKLPPVGLDLMLQIITGLGVQCLTR